MFKNLLAILFLGIILSMLGFSNKEKNIEIFTPINDFAGSINEKDGENFLSILADDLQGKIIQQWGSKESLVNGFKHRDLNLKILELNLLNHTETVAVVQYHFQYQWNQKTNEDKKGIESISKERGKLDLINTHGGWKIYSFTPDANTEAKEVLTFMKKYIEALNGKDFVTYLNTLTDEFISDAGGINRLKKSYEENDLQIQFLELIPKDITDNSAHLLYTVEIKNAGESSFSSGQYILIKTEEGWKVNNKRENN